MDEARLRQRARVSPLSKLQSDCAFLLSSLTLLPQVSALQLPRVSHNGAPRHPVNHRPLHKLRHAHPAVVFETSEPLDQVRALARSRARDGCVTVDAGEGLRWIDRVPWLVLAGRLEQPSWGRSIHGRRRPAGSPEFRFSSGSWRSVVVPRKHAGGGPARCSACTPRPRTRWRSP